MEEIFLDIAGFIIRIAFRPTKLEISTYIKEKLKREILEYCSSFIIEKRPKKADFYIDFFEKLKPEIAIDKKRKIYHLLYQDRGKNRLVTSNEISLYQFQLILRQALYRLLLGKGFMLHSSSVLINGKVYCFLGRSGAGKSTAARFLSGKYKALSDDTSLFKKEDGSFYFCMTPVMERALWFRKKAVRYPLGKVFFLRKADFFKVKKVEDKKYILEGLIKQALIEKEDINKKMKFLLNFVSSFNQFYFLYFAKNEKKMIEFFDNL